MLGIYALFPLIYLEVAPQGITYQSHRNSISGSASLHMKLFFPLTRTTTEASSKLSADKLQTSEHGTVPCLRDARRFFYKC
jgi:hypothetical protein